VTVRIYAVKKVESGVVVPDIYRESGVSTATFYKWQLNMIAWMSP
jgi:hypothetical protein